jgi:UDP-N-acetylglucosamine 2-epimerase
MDTIMKVMSIVGTRPEIIKMSEIIKKLDEYTDHTFIHTGQNYDYELNEIFFKDLNLRKPDHVLDTAGNSLAETVGNIMYEVEKMLKLYEPDAVVILGDTNSALSGIIAKRMKIPLFHLEAGNRCFDDNVPEEINRRILDHISDINLVYTENQRRNLHAEGLAKDRVFVMGSPMREVFDNTLIEIESSEILNKLDLEPDGYFLVSIHRDENVEIDKNLEELMFTLEKMHHKYELPIIVSTHPRLKKKLQDRQIRGVQFMKPFGFLDYNKLQMNAKCVVSDSGTISEESSLLGFPAITIRNAMERLEAVDTGSIIMTGVDSENILRCIDIVTPPTEVPYDYDVANCAERVVKAVIGYTPYINRYVWHK